MNLKKILQAITGAAVILSLPACNGICEHVYHKPSSENGNVLGFIIGDEETRTGRLYRIAAD